MRNPLVLQAFPDVAAEFRQLLVDLAAEPRIVTVIDGATGNGGGGQPWLTRCERVGSIDAPCATVEPSRTGYELKRPPRQPRRTSGRTRTISTTLCALCTAMLTSALR